ncbi:hypothetical protein D9613_012070 [Agrocybe pediades]|uniref:HNH nuclease domain-containing protein n=1 Tax=Agrocybe pediades TaxID=84607 RepID=A0A8H4QF43_9AGAR|nr:hypothetical protein D9613_012070 [Agrocybe pediades]
MITDYLVEAPESYSTAKKKALVRDNFCCVISGSYDHDSLMGSEELSAEYCALNPFPQRVFTECAHILPDPSMNAQNPPDSASDKRTQGSMLWVVLQRFGYTTLPNELEGENIHRLENIMTLRHDEHTVFTRFLLWFVATETPNEYTIRTAYPGLTPRPLFVIL